MLTLVLLSGGLDSVALVSFYRASGRDMLALYVDYGQLAARYERRAAVNVASHYGIDLIEITYTGVKKFSNGYIPGRNALLLSVALTEFPESSGVVSIGIHSGTDYVDSWGSFIEKMQDVYDVYADGRIQVDAPFLEWNKGQVYSLCINNRVPVELTYSCEVGTSPPCGQCLSCRDRIFLNAY